MFQRFSSNWVRYNKYEWRTAENGKCYITPAKEAKPAIYNPIKDYEQDKNERNLYRQGMAAFGGVAPTYHIELQEHPTLVWDFNSLLLCVQMMLSFMLTDDNSSLKICKHCGKAFVAPRPNVEFCSPQCKNQYNVYKSRAKKNDTPT